MSRRPIEPHFEIKKVTLPTGSEAVLLEIQGPLDDWTVGEVDRVLEEIFAAGHLLLAVDMPEVPYTEGAPLHSLTHASRRAKSEGGGMILFSLAPAVSEVIGLMGMTELECVDTCSEALSRLTCAG